MFHNDIGLSILYGSYLPSKQNEVKELVYYNESYLSSLPIFTSPPDSALTSRSGLLIISRFKQTKFLPFLTLHHLTCFKK